jgi:hypothetical protein
MYGARGPALVFGALYVLCIPKRLLDLAQEWDGAERSE